VFVYFFFAFMDAFFMDAAFFIEAFLAATKRKSKIRCPLNVFSFGEIWKESQQVDSREIFHSSSELYQKKECVNKLQALL